MADHSNAESEPEAPLKFVYDTNKVFNECNFHAPVYVTLQISGGPGGGQGGEGDPGTIGDPDNSGGG